MTSAAQVLANRSNARKSTGPRTPQGKATASRNAVKHGLLAEQVVIHGEDPAQFECYRDGMLRELAPVGVVEEMLAQRVVSLSWRLRRAERLQSAVFATVYRENADDIVLWPKHGLPIQPGPDEDEVILGQVVMTDFARAQVLDRLLVYERRIENSLYRTMGQLRKEREARATAVLEATSRSAGDLPAGQEPAAGAELGSFGADGPSAGGTGSGCGCDARFVSRLREGVSSSGCVGRAPALRLTPVATETSFATAAVSPSARLEGVSRFDVSPAVGQEPVAPAELASFGANAAPEEVAGGEEGGCGCDARIVSRLRGGVSSGGCVGRAPAPRVTPVATETSFATAAVSPSADGNHRQDADATRAHGRDARATGTPYGVTASDEGRATRPPAETFHASPFTLHDPSCETKPISGGISS